MNESSIKKLRKKFTLSAFLSFLAVMLFMGAMIFFINFYSSSKQINSVLDFIIDNGGEITEKSFERIDKYNFPQDSLGYFFSELFGTGLDTSPEFRFSTRYFSVVYTDNGEIESVLTNNIAAVTADDAIKYADKVLASNSSYGMYGNYNYKVKNTEEGKLVVFLDCTSQRNVSKRLLSIISLLTLFGALAMYILVRVLSRRMIMPEIKNAERQKRFITNAGHELKTPLAVIRANTELDIMLNGENEWNQSTLRQTESMTKLIQDLILIARSDETDRQDDLIDTDVSEAVKDASQELSSLAVQSGKKLEEKITDGLKMKAAEGHIKQLAALLIDNAIKYCDDEGTVSVELSQKGKVIRLVVSNDYKDGDKVDCSRFFERFYRAEESHSTEKSGYGIGLSIAESLVKRYGGSIKADWNSGIIRFTCTFKSV